jgi:adenine-specific DNA-methyltransferase
MAAVAIDEHRAIVGPDRGTDTPARQKARGAFFTPVEVCDHLTRWAVRSAEDLVLEPSAGEAAFLLSAVRRLTELGATPGGISLDGSEIHRASAARARDLVARQGARANIVVGDFLRRPARPVYDAVIGNPPYIRYQDFTGEHRRAALEAALAQGVRLTRLASSWAAFVVHSAAFLNPYGRLGLVVPAELLAANYAAEVRSFLMARFARVTLVLFEEQVFPGVATEAVLLMAEGCGGTDHIEVYQVQNPSSLGSRLGDARSFSTSASSKWTRALSPAGAFDIGDGLIDSGKFATLSAWGKARLGAVTGNNRYFLLSPQRVHELRIPPSELLPLSPPGSRHLRSLRLSPSSLRRLGEQGLPTWLFYPGARPSRAALRYIGFGEAEGVHEAYKCRVRSPWWRVPVLGPPHLFLTYMNADTPRLALNSARARHVNSVHGVYLPAELRSLALPLAVASVNSATMLGAETVGRSYGGGILKLEPGESAHLPVPSVDLVRRHAPELRALAVPMGRLLRKGNLLLAAELVDDLLLRGAAGLDDAEVLHVRQALAALVLRRLTRGRSGRAPVAAPAAAPVAAPGRP